jgi:uncharacterized membrane protein
MVRFCRTNSFFIGSRDLTPSRPRLMALVVALLAVRGRSRIYNLKERQWMRFQPQRTSSEGRINAEPFPTKRLHHHSDELHGDARCGSGSAGSHIPCDCFSTYYSRFCQIVHSL